MISSELPEILGMSDRVLVMREGRLVAELSRAEATQERVIAEAAGTLWARMIARFRAGLRPQETRRCRRSGCGSWGSSICPVCRGHLLRHRWGRTSLTVKQLAGHREGRRDFIVVAVGETMVVLTRNIDLSVGSMVGLRCVSCRLTSLARHNGAAAGARRSDRDWWIGIVLGLVNGLLVVVGTDTGDHRDARDVGLFIAASSFEITAGDQVSAFQLPDSFP